MTTRSGRRTIALAAGITALIGLPVGPAHGVPITFQFAGVIDSVDDPDNVLEDAVLPGNPFSGSYTFESTTPDSLPGDPEVGLYGPPGPLILFRIDTLDIAVAPDNSRIGVANRVSTSHPRDAYGPEALSPFPLGDLTIIEIGLTFEDQEGLVFGSDALPLLPPDLDAFGRRELRIQGQKQKSAHFFILGTVTTLTPEPTSVVTLVLGLALLTRRRGGR